MSWIGGSKILDRVVKTVGVYRKTVVLRDHEIYVDGDRFVACFGCRDYLGLAGVSL